jgi:hypothetical protein
MSISIQNKQANRIYWARLLFLSFILGAIAGTTGDYVHVSTHVDGYPANGAFPFLPLDERMPVWVPFLFGGAVMLMATMHKLLSKLYHPRLEKHFVLGSVAPLIFVTIYALTGVFQTGTGGWEDVWLAAVAILLWWIMDGTRTGAILALVIAFFGTCFEMFLVSSGAFFYFKEHSNMLGVPSWLPWLYMVASVCISLFVRLI